MSIRRINFASVPVADQDRALAFYRDRLGFAVTLDAPYREGWRWIFLQPPGAETRLHFAARDEMTLDDDQPALALVAEDVDDLARSLEADGVGIEQGPDDAPWTPGVRWILIRDSERNLVLIESQKEA